MSEIKKISEVEAGGYFAVKSQAYGEIAFRKGLTEAELPTRLWDAVYHDPTFGPDTVVKRLSIGEAQEMAKANFGAIANGGYVKPAPENQITLPRTLGVYSDMYCASVNGCEGASDVAKDLLKGVIGAHLDNTIPPLLTVSGKSQLAASGIVFINITDKHENNKLFEIAEYTPVDPNRNRRFIFLRAAYPNGTVTRIDQIKPT